MVSYGILWYPLAALMLVQRPDKRPNKWPFSRNLCVLIVINCHYFGRSANCVGRCVRRSVNGLAVVQCWMQISARVDFTLDFTVKRT